MSFKPHGRVTADTTTTPSTQLTEQPAVGSFVKLIVDNPFLSEHLSAPKGAIGKILAHSTINNHQDPAVIVDWGFGRQENPHGREGIRIALHEISMATEAEIEAVSSRFGAPGTTPSTSHEPNT